MTTGTTTLISGYSSGPDILNTSYLPTISDDGSYVAFSSLGTGLLPTDQNLYEDVYGVQLLADSTSSTPLLPSSSPALS
ncbi:MAG: hypothetical protein HC866_14690 [Leptolyngbyaceae cyanobacterium RU_5_1]|nr:hypothetical protein [Leptolyngbyaceae cyanobacterium RU_5_1]